MKILSWVKHPVLVILLILLVSSCSTTTYTKKDQLTATAIRLADELVKKQDYQQACSVYERAIEKSDDYRLYYNLSILKALCEEDWLPTTEYAIKKYPDQKQQFLKLQVKLAENDDNKQVAVDSLEQLCKLNPDDTTLQKQYCKALIANSQNGRALAEAMKLWNSGVFDQETAEILYTINPKEWKVVYEALCPTAE